MEHNRQLKGHLVTPSQLAEILGITRESVYSLKAQRKLPFYKPFGTVYFDLNEIMEIIKDSRVERGLTDEEVDRRANDHFQK